MAYRTLSLLLLASACYRGDVDPPVSPTPPPARPPIAAPAPREPYPYGLTRPPRSCCNEVTPKVPYADAVRAIRAADRHVVLHETARTEAMSQALRNAEMTMNVSGNHVVFEIDGTDELAHFGDHGTEFPREGWQFGAGIEWYVASVHDRPGARRGVSYDVEVDTIVPATSRTDAERLLK